MSMSLNLPVSPSLLRWPLPAVGTWIACWCLQALLSPYLGVTAATVAAAAAGAGAAWPVARPWRRLLVAAGFPLSALAAGAAAGWPAWAWLLPLALLLAAYPVRAWRDAPVYPTPAGALDGLAARLPLPDGARVLDAGCGLGDGLRALRSAWPAARIEGVEWSWPLALATRLRCPWARVRQGDMWRGSWGGHALVYVFQRPESMARAWAKASAEMAPGSWLVSLEFAVPGRPADLSFALPGGRPVMAWRVGPRGPQSAGARADNPR